MNEICEWAHNGLVSLAFHQSNRVVTPLQIGELKNYFDCGGEDERTQGEAHGHKKQIYGAFLSLDKII